MNVKLYQPCEARQILLPEMAHCLSARTFLKMSGVKFSVEYRANAEYMSPTGKVPFLTCGETIVADIDPIIAFVNHKGINISSKLTNVERSDMRAFISLVNSVLQNAELYMCWCDRAIYKSVTRPRYGSIFPWPLNYLVTWQKRKAVTERLAALEWQGKKLDEVVSEVSHCCRSLSEMLLQGPYFFGHHPTELDAIVFGHLFSILTTPLPGNHLSSVVQSYPNLVAFCKKVELDYFAKKNPEILVPPRGIPREI